MIQGYLHSLHIRVVSIVFLENSIHGTEFLFFTCVIKMQQNMTLVREMATPPQPGGRASFTSSVTWQLAGRGQVISPLCA